MALIFILIVTAIVVLLFIRPTLMREASDPRLRPVTQDEIERGVARLSAERLPIVRLHCTNEAPGSANTSIGGRIWVPDAKTSWPVDADGVPYLHLAQINFTEFDAPDGFPEFGLIQIFIHPERLRAGNPDHVDQPLMIRWYDTIERGISLSQPEESVNAQNLIFATSMAQTTGVLLRPEPRDLPANPYAWPFNREVAGDLTTRRPIDDATAELQQGLHGKFDDIVNAHGAHWLGGHPGFAIDDIRGYHPPLQ
ncbi:MAG: DUF1963 domain-containing protein, partial [Pseudomonadota bacterium]